MEKIQNDLTTICTEKTIHMHDSRESIYKWDCTQNMMI